MHSPSGGSQAEVLFERQLIKFAKDLQITIDNENVNDDIEYISSYLTFMKFARVFAPEPGSCLSSWIHRSGIIRTTCQ